MRLGRSFLFLAITLFLTATVPADNSFAPAKPPATQRAAALKKSPTAPPPEITPDTLNRIKTSLFRVESKMGSAPAILLTTDGLAVTSFHAFRGAASAVGVFADQPKHEIPLELWAVNPKLDLAIVQIKPGHSESAPQAPGHVEISEYPPAHGERVWSPAFSDAGFAINNGTVTAVQEFDALPIAMQQSFAQHAAWIKTDCAVTTANGGDPLIDTHGKLVGLNVWRWEYATSSNGYYTLGVAAVKELLATLPKTPLSFSTAATRFGKAAGPRITFPDLAVTRDQSAESIAAQAASMANSGICDACHGKGFIFHDEVVGERGKYHNEPIHKKVEETCPTCHGDKYIATALRNAAPRVVDAFAHAKADDPDLKRSTAQAAASLRKLLAIDPVRLDRMLIADSETEISREHSVVGSPVIAVGIPTDDAHFSGDTAHYKLIRCGTAFFLLRDPVFAQPGSGKPSLFGGLVAGDAERYDGEVVHVLKNGFLVDGP